MQDPESIEPNNSTVSSNGSFFLSPKTFIVFIISILVIGAAAYGTFSPDKKSNPPKDNLSVVTPTESIRALSSDMIVYGVWKDDRSVIKLYDIFSKKEYKLAELPINIKKVTVLSPSKLLYIGETNDRDHGGNLSIYDAQTKNSRVVYKPVDGFGIDDYVLSQDKKYVSTWEVLFKEGSNVLLGGKSRVYSINLLNSQKHLIYDEIAEKAVHYPRAITSSGEIFLDTFLPNTIAGWAYGMSISNFDGSDKKDLENMKNGTYGTQPSISLDEKYLVFSGYDKIDGEEVDDNGVRRALNTPNTIEILDIQSKERQKLSNLSSEDNYLLSGWDKNRNVIVYSLSSKDSSKSGKYIYNLATSKSKKINNSSITALSENYFLLAKKGGQVVSSIGNLGDSYNTSISEFSIYNDLDSKTVPLKMTENLMQFISLIPSDYFRDVGNLEKVNSKTIQLLTFDLKPTLAQKRREQQSNPLPVPNPTNGCPPQACKRSVWGAPACCNLPKPPTCNEWFAQHCAKNPAACYDENGEPINDLLVACHDSPLYFYGNPGTKVNVKVKTYVYNSDPSYNSESGYNVTLLEDGKMEVRGKVYDRINYDYISSKITPPDYGIVVSKERLKESLIDMASKLGLNKKETDDLVGYGNKNVKAPFIFVSFYDQETSKKILPLEFNPRPETYINIVFYFKEYKQKPAIQFKSPVFKMPTKRSGFTAVEISEVIEK